MSSLWIERDVTALRPPARGGHAVGAFTSLRAPVPINAVADRAVGSNAAGTPSTSEQAVQDTMLLVFGGADPFGITYNDVFAVRCGATGSCPVMQLQNSGASVGPRGRSGHSLVSIDGGRASSTSNVFAEFVVFGGMSPIPELVQYNDVWILSIHRASCDEAAASSSQQAREALIRWAQPPTTGDAPTPRNDHACCVVESNMLVVGGATSSGPTNNAFVLSLATFAWRPLLLPSAFIPREMTTCTFVGGSHALIYGGRSSDALLGDAWLCSVGDDAVTVPLAGAFPPRCCHTASFDAATRTLHVAGGFSDGDHASDVALVLEAASEGAATRTAKAIELPRKDARKGMNLLFGFGHSSVTAADGRVYVVGGIHVDDIGSTMQLFELTRSAT